MVMFDPQMPNSERKNEPRQIPEESSFPGLKLASPASQRGNPEDSEMLLRKAFEIGISQGIELLFRWYYRPLCSHAIRYVSSREIAEDIVSDVYYKFHTDRIYNSIETSFRAYLFTAVRHRAFDYVRVEMKRNTSLDQASLLAGQMYEAVHQVRKIVRAKLD